MKIVDVRATPVTVPVNRHAQMAHSAYSATTRTIIEIVADTGQIGWGEAPLADAADIVTTFLRPRILGLDPTEISVIRRHCFPDQLDLATPQLNVRRAAFGGLELALWDLAGKRYGVPLYKLLGGRVRERAPFVAYAYAVKSPDRAAAVTEMVAHAIDLVGRTGARMFEFKIGVDVDADIDIIRRLRESLPANVMLGADANLGMTFEDAYRLLANVPQGALCNLEEPCATLAECERLGAMFAVPISSHAIDPMIVRGYPGISGAVPTLEIVGGLSELARVLPALAALGKRTWLRSLAELGISWAAMVHAGVAMRELERPGQSLIHTVESTLIHGDPWLLNDGGVVPPERPGLGVEIDRDALARYHALYVASGQCELFNPPLPAVLP